MSDQSPYWTIDKANTRIRALIEEDTTLTTPFWIGGVVSNFSQSNAGHLYFNLNDGDFSIRCVVFNNIRGTISFAIRTGLEIEVFGTIGVYVKRASIEMQVEQAKLIETHNYVPDQSVIEKMTAAGLWPPKKQAIPDQIRKIGLITGRRSEAKYDFENTYRANNGTAQIELVDVLLQGDRAAVQIANAISKLSSDKTIDVIVIVRGGGRADDLDTFNSYGIAEAIARSPVPVITGIGHHQDRTFADEVADAASSTPTAAAHLLISQQGDAPTSQTAAQQSRPLLYYGLGLIGLAIVVLLIILITMQSAN